MGYGTGSSFLLDFEHVSPSKKTSKALDNDLDFEVGHNHVRIKSGRVATNIKKFCK